MTWCCKVTDLDKHDLYSRGYLFSTLYIFFRLGYQSNGLYITPNEVNIPKKFRELFFTLPLDLQQNVVKRTWNEGGYYNKVIVRDNHPILPFHSNSYLLYMED